MLGLWFGFLFVILERSCIIWVFLQVWVFEVLLSDFLFVLGSFFLLRLLAFLRSFEWFDLCWSVFFGFDWIFELCLLSVFSIYIFGVFLQKRWSKNVCENDFKKMSIWFDRINNHVIDLMYCLYLRILGACNKTSCIVKTLSEFGFPNKKFVTYSLLIQEIFKDKDFLWVYESLLFNSESNQNLFCEGFLTISLSMQYWIFFWFLKLLRVAKKKVEGVYLYCSILANDCFCKSLILVSDEKDIF